jgi:DNA-binding XRE family transcriptional regulator
MAGRYPNNLRHVRRISETKLPALALDTGLDVRLIRAIELGQINPFPDVRQRLAQSMRTTVEEIWPNQDVIRKVGEA